MIDDRRQVPFTPVDGQMATRQAAELSGPILANPHTDDHVGNRQPFRASVGAGD